MLLLSRRSKLMGSVRIPGSKSHTIRAIAAASMADGISRIDNPLLSSDTLAAIDAYRAFGASIEVGNYIEIDGLTGIFSAPDNVIDLGNSGTTLYIAMGTAALIDSWTIFTGDDQLRNRPAGPLLKALKDLGAEAISARGDDRPPLMIRGPMKGGSTTLDGSKTSQYLTGLLMNCPLAQSDTDISVFNVTERPYINMTLKWLSDIGARCEYNDDFTSFHIPGRQSYKAFRKSIPGDFSSACFFMCAAAITGSTIEIYGLDMNDTQGDKGVVDVLAKMGVDFREISEGGLLVSGGNELKGGDFDLGDMPDALPILAVTACFADGTTRLYNVAQARLKETDRIHVMCQELTKLGGIVRELPDGLEIEGTGGLNGGEVSGHGDHRVVMALAVAGLACDDWVQVNTAEAINVTFPNFTELLQQLGAAITKDRDRYDLFEGG